LIEIKIVATLDRKNGGKVWRLSLDDWTTLYCRFLSQS
jgi:hypothetical protein